MIVYNKAIDLNYITNTMSQHISKIDYNNVISLINTVNKLWSIDVIIRNYTSHKIDHNLRVLYYSYKLLEASNMKTDSTGYYIITLAAILHDIGMQCNDKEIIKKYCDLYPSDEKELQSIIRKNHASICVDFIEKLRNTSEGEIGKLLGLIDVDIIDSVCELINYHSGNLPISSNEVRHYYNYGVEKQLLPLLLTLRLADELDIGRERSSEESILFSRLPQDYLSFFWLHYITKISFVAKNIIKIILEINPKDKEKEGFLKQKIYDSFISKNRILLKMLREQCCIAITFEYGLLLNRHYKQFDPIVYDFLVSQTIDDSFFDDIPTFTYNVLDITEVYSLDNILLPLLYEDKKYNYAVTEEQAILCADKNPYMTIGAYKKGKLIGYLTFWPVTSKTLDKLLSFDIFESNLDFDNDILTYETYNTNICWYVSGLGVVEGERLRNYPHILKSMIDKSLELIKNILKPNNILIERIGATVYTPAAERLCIRHFDMYEVNKASYSIGGFLPKSYVVDVNEATCDIICKMRELQNVR